MATSRSEPSTAASPRSTRSAAALAVTADRLDQLVSRERAFSADASHQLRTPLAGLRLQLETALAESGNDPTPPFEHALVQVDRLDATIDDLLALRRDAEPRRVSLEVAAVLDGVDARWRGALAEHGRPLRVRADEHLPPVTVSAAAVRQILDVLVANALEHGAGPVDVVARSTGGGLALEVSDEGPGVAAEGRVAIFTRRTPNEDRGIGLPLARSLAEAEGGRLILRGDRATCTFSLLFPPAP